MIRFAEHTDLAGIRCLWERCFPDEGGFNEYYFEHFFRLDRTLLSVEQGALCAMVQMLPYRLQENEGGGDITYIYGACTDPAFRRQGHMARLLEFSFTLDQKEGRLASALIPAEPWLFDFYKPFGYEPFFRIKRGEFTGGQGGAAPRRLTRADIPQLQTVYDRYAGSCRIARAAAYWEGQIQMFDELGSGVFGWFEGTKMQAYAFCWADHAQEALGVSPEQAKGLLRQLSRDTLSYTAPGEDTALGCIRWYGEPVCAQGYMNLMLN